MHYKDILQSRRKPLKYGVQFGSESIFGGTKLSLYLTKEPKSGCAAAHPAHPVPPALHNIQLRAKQTAPLVNKHYENEVTLR